METSISTEGYLFITIAWGSVSIMLGFCLYKVLKTEPKKETVKEND
jgi:hypothetical protein